MQRSSLAVLNWFKLQEATTKLRPLTTYLLVGTSGWMTEPSNRREKILRCTQSFIIAGDYNSFSYADISKVVVSERRAWRAVIRACSRRRKNVWGDHPPRSYPPSKKIISRSARLLNFSPYLPTSRELKLRKTETFVKSEKPIETNGAALFSR